MPCRIASQCGCFILLMLCSVQTCLSQLRPLIFEKFSSEAGLPNNLFKYMIEDSDGILWMSGGDGLVRYDGYAIQSFRHSNADTTSISANSIFALFEDSKGRLWVSSFGGGIDVSNSAKTSFRHINLTREDGQPLKVNTVQQIEEDKHGDIWMMSDTALIIVEEREGNFTASDHHQFLNRPGVCSALTRPTAIRMAPDGRIWLGTETGLCIYDPDKRLLSCPEETEGLPLKKVQDIEYDREGRLWIAFSANGPRFYYANSDEPGFHAFDVPGMPYGTKSIQFTFDLDNRLWFSVFSDQIYGYDFRDSSLFLQSGSNSNVAHERFLRNPFVDHSGNVWIHGEGCLIYRYPKGFNNYLHPFPFHQSCSSIYGEGDDMWYAYRPFGLLRVNQVSGKTRFYSSDAEPDQDRIASNQISEILKVRSGNTIIVGFGFVAVMDSSGRVLKNFSVPGTNRAGFEDSKGRIWIGGFIGLLLFSEVDGVMQTYSLPPRLGDARNFIQGITEDKQGQIWFGSGLHGLAVLNPESGSVQQFLPVPGDLKSLPSGTIIDMANAGDTLWIATDVALVRFDTRTHQVMSYDNTHGLASDYISSVLCGQDGNIWVSTNGGISSLNPLSGEFTNYSVKDGLLNHNYYSSARHMAPDGTLYFGGENGVDFFHPSELRKNPTPPRMYFYGAKVNNSTFYPGREIINKPLSLSFRDDQITFDFAGLHYAELDKVTYQYQMHGINDAWMDLGDQHSVSFFNLKPGDYVFHAKAISGDNVVSLEELNIPVHIAPPFYGTMWFRILGAVALAGLLFLYIKFREERIQRKERYDAEVARKMNELERRALQAQMNPHFIYNCMNSIQQFMILHDYEGAMKYLTRFSRVLRTVLNVSGKTRIALSDEIKLIEDYIELESMRFPNKFTYRIAIAPEINIHTVEIPPFFVQPQVENAIRHGLLNKAGHGTLLVSIDAVDQKIRITVEDDGIGREAANAAKMRDRIIHETKGLSITKERLAHLHPENGNQALTIVDLRNAKGLATGTRVEISLPLE